MCGLLRLGVGLRLLLGRCLRLRHVRPGRVGDGEEAQGRQERAGDRCLVGGRLRGQRTGDHRDDSSRAGVGDRGQGGRATGVDVRRIGQRLRPAPAAVEVDPLHRHRCLLLRRKAFGAQGGEHEPGLTGLGSRGRQFGGTGHGQCGADRIRTRADAVLADARVEELGDGRPILGNVGPAAVATVEEGDQRAEGRLDRRRQARGVQRLLCLAQDGLLCGTGDLLCRGRADDGGRQRDQRVHRHALGHQRCIRLGLRGRGGDGRGRSGEGRAGREGQHRQCEPRSSDAKHWCSRP